jgi:hypothetical protein
MTSSGTIQTIAICILIIGTLLIYPIDGNTLKYPMRTNLKNSDASFVGEQAWELSGYSVANVGDVNGDGFADILIGAPSANNYAGKAYLIFGSASGWKNDISLSFANASFLGEHQDDEAGWTVAGAGDVNGDGYKDILIGAPQNSDPWSYSGKAYLIFGKSSGWARDTSLSKADASFKGLTWDQEIGYILAGAGDVNGDGNDDILMSAYKNSTGNPHVGQTYLIFGKQFGWAKNTLVTKADASFIGELANDYSGSTAGAGDVNDDGYDDILIGAGRNPQGGTNAGKTYLIFGKPSGWTMGINLANANATFIGEHANDESGYGIGAGDVDGDGIDDFLISAPGNSYGGINAGQIYLFFGKTSGWKKDVSLINANASFIGEHPGKDGIGGIANAGDVNGDGYNDILISSMTNSDGGFFAGQTYLVLGKPSGWAKYINISKADASFIGKTIHEISGCSISGGSDVNGDGYDDILIGANLNNESAPESGKTYLIFPDSNSKPTSITSVKAYRKNYVDEISYGLVNDTIFVQLNGIDGNSTRQDISVVRVTSSRSDPVGFLLRLYETGINTGKYRGNFTIKNMTREELRWIKADPGEAVNITSVWDHSKFKIIPMGKLELWPKTAIDPAIEDKSYSFHFWAKNATDLKWTVKTNASWLSWDSWTQNISGIPDNGNVGSYYIDVNISMPWISDEHNFTLVVKNVPPKILTKNITTAVEDQKYQVQYSCDENNRGKITWHLATNATWLKINATNGNLSGIPTNDDVGKYWVNVTVDDGNGGWDHQNFALTVFDVNDPPVITTKDVMTANQDKPYYLKYNATDIDHVPEVMIWSLVTNATWLELNTTTGVLNGTPTNDEVGWYHVNITVSDGRGGTDSHDFNMTVININDPPFFASVPNKTARVGQLYYYFATAMDIDKDDVLVYSLGTSPENMTINPTTGIIMWIPSNAQVGSQSVIVKVTDGHVIVEQSFSIVVVRTSGNQPPTVTLLIPKDKAVLGYTNPILSWSAVDKDSDELTYDVFLGTAQFKVIAGDRSTLVASGVKDTFYPLTVVKKGSNFTILEKGKTYYWTIIPYDKEGPGNSISGIWSFTIGMSATENNPPTFISQPVTSAISGKAYQYDEKAIDKDTGDVLTYSLEKCPVNMTIDQSMGRISWTPGAHDIGTVRVIVVVSDGKVSVKQTFAINVILPPDRKPTITSQPSKTTITVGDKFEYRVIATDPDSGDILTYSLKDAPTGMNINSSTGLISWKPNEHDIGSHTIIIRVADNHSLDDVQTITINVNKKKIDQFMFSTISLIFLIILISVVIFIVAYFIFKKRSGKN